MGIQYVTVKIDTSGLYQPLASATGVVGIVGPAPGAGPGFSNPTLFTRPLTGAGGEPYARIVPVLMVAPLASDVWTLSIAGAPTGGTFTLSFASQTTAPIPFNATSAEVQTALQNLAAIGPGNVVCTGGPLPSNNVTITFAGTLGFQALSPISVGASNLTGGTGPATTLAHTVTGSARSNDVQTLSLSGNPTGGSFTLSFGGQTTAAIPFNATSAQVQAALQTLVSVGAGNVICGGGPLPAAVVITFEAALGLQPQAPITVGASNLTGPAPAVAHTTSGAGVNDLQTLSISGNPTGGSFALAFGGQTTAAIPSNATAAQVQASLVALSSIGAGNVACAGGPLPGTAVTVTFQGTLGFAAQPPMTVPTNNLTGGTNPAPAIAHTATGSGVNDVQTLSLGGAPAGGTFALAFGGQTTTAISFNATAAQVQSALQALSSIGSGNVVCSAGPLPGNVTITFIGALAAHAQPVLGTAANNLTGPGPQIVHTTTGVGINSIAVPVDGDFKPIPNVGWDPVRNGLVDLTTQASLTLDPANRVLRYPSQAVFQNGGENATVELGGLSIASATVSGTPAFWGVPLDTDGQPVANLLMRPDVAPGSAFVDFAGNALAVDGALGLSSGGTGRPIGIGGSIYYAVSFDICSLAKSINLALTNGAIKVWGYRLDPSQQALDASAAFSDFSSRAIDIVCLSADSNPDNITALKNHVEASSPNDAGGGGIRPRIGVAMLPMGGIADTSGNITNKFSDWKSEEQVQKNLPSPMNWSSSRMVFVVANSPDDIAAAAAGVIAGVDPWISLILKPVNGIGINGILSDQAIQTFLAPAQSNLTQPHVNPILHPDFMAGSGPVMGEGFSADGTGQRLYVDIVRTIDDIAFQMKATLTSPQVIGTLRINRPGLRVLTSIIRAALKARVAIGEIDDFAIDIPIQALTEKDPAQLSPDEQQQLQQVQNSRQLALNISITYAGAIHQLVVMLKFI
jgi:hypothetical protein